MDIDLIRTIRDQREADGLDHHDEVWDGIYIMSPGPNFDHQLFELDLFNSLKSILAIQGGGIVVHEFNISDRVEGWEKNYRLPDVAVNLAGNPAINHATHMVGGPDLAIEILNPRDLARQKLDFYAKVNTPEFLLLDRDHEPLNFID